MQIIGKISLGGGGAIVLLEWHGSYGKSNILRLDQDGQVVWQAELVGKDAYVAVRLDDGHLRATSFGGWAADIDLSTGRVIRKDWVK
jgi:hypothetical protein